MVLRDKLNFKLIIGMCCLLCLSQICYSQTKDSIGSKMSPTQFVSAYSMARFTEARPFSLEYSHLGDFNYKPEFRGVDYPEKKATTFSQLRVNSNLKLITRKNWMLTTTLGYQYTSLESEAVANAGDNRSKEFHYHSEALNFTYLSKLFGKPAIYNATIMSDGSEQHFERIRGFLMAAIVLKADTRTKMSVGLVGIVDPTSPIPVVPTFSYEKRYENGWMIDVLIPQRIMARKHFATKNRLSIGTEISNTTFYLYDIDGTSTRYQYRQAELLTGLTYERLIGDYFIIAAKSGVRASPYGRGIEKGNSFSDYTWEVKNDPAFYFNIGISYNPFAKAIKKK